MLAVQQPTEVTDEDDGQKEEPQLPAREMQSGCGSRACRGHLRHQSCGFERGIRSKQEEIEQTSLMDSVDEMVS